MTHELTLQSLLLLGLVFLRLQWRVSLLFLALGRLHSCLHCWLKTMACTRMCLGGRNRSKQPELSISLWMRPCNRTYCINACLHACTYGCSSTQGTPGNGYPELSRSEHDVATKAHGDCHCCTSAGGIESHQPEKLPPSQHLQHPDAFLCCLVTGILFLGVSHPSVVLRQ
jgi:hypothetical protein